MAVRSLRILVEATWPDDSVDRLWDGSGPFVDGDGEVWRGCTLTEGLDAIEQAFNGEASTLNIALTGVDSQFTDFAWLNHEEENVIGGTIRIMILPCDENDQPSGDPQVKFIGTIDNIIFDDSVSGDKPVSDVVIECTNRFADRRRSNGGVLSDADQRARSAAINPSADPDRFCERVPLMKDKTIVWPRWN